MAEDFKLPFDPSILMEYINSNAMMIAIILLVTIVTLVGFAKLKHSIVPWESPSLLPARLCR